MNVRIIPIPMHVLYNPLMSQNNFSACLAAYAYLSFFILRHLNMHCGFFTQPNYIARLYFVNRHHRVNISAPIFL